MIQPPHAKLRFGVMVPSHTLAWWQAETLRRVMGSGLAEPALVIVDRSSMTSAKRRWNALGWRAFNRLVVRDKVSAAWTEPWADLLASVPQMVPTIEQAGKYAQRFAGPDVEKIKSFDLDFILRFGFNIIRGDVLSAARHGVWSYHHGDLFVARGQPACFWELYRDEPVVGITLQRLTDVLDGGCVLAQRHVAAIRHSYPATRDTVLRAGVGMVEQACRRLTNERLARPPTSPSATTAPIDRTPTNGTVVSFALKCLWRFCQNAIDNLVVQDQWNVGLSSASAADVLAGRIGHPRWLPDLPRGEFLADPFAVRTATGLCILAEHLADTDGVGRIRQLDVSANGEVRSVREPFRLPAHVSYPYMVRHEDRYLCVPEMAGTGEVAVYDTDGEMKTWTRVGTILSNIRLLDPTLFRFEGRWWLMGVIREQGRADQLMAWYASDPLGRWRPHADNPLKMDPRSTRPAGTPFVQQGVLYRPAQDCSRTYGGAVVINRVRQLTPERFAEEPIARIQCAESWPYRRGLHTLSQVDDHTFAIDAKRRIIRGTALRRRLGLAFRRSSSPAKPM